MTDFPQTTLPPEVGEVWRARDGRRFRVTGFVQRGLVPHSHVGVLLEVLPPFAARQKRKTEMKISYFGLCKFMRREVAANG